MKYTPPDMTTNTTNTTDQENLIETATTEETKPQDAVGLKATTAEAAAVAEAAAKTEQCQTK
jgi:hypothetical protein